MNTLITKATLASAVALSIVACSPAGTGGLAGIGGSGYVSSGSVTGFGSVFVNGVEFDTSSATFDVDGSPGTQDDLGIGMIVQVNGSINDDGITGTATSINFDDELQGPVAGPITPSVDGLTKSFTVLGTTVIIDSSSTTFDISNDVTLPAGTTFDFTSIAEKNNVEISGFFDTNGDLIATRVELKNLTFDTSSIIEIKGTITNLTGTTFTLQAGVASITVDASSASLNDLPNGLVENTYIEAKGTFDTATTTLTASKIEAEDNSIDDTDEFELEGLVSDYVDDSNFKIDDTPVDASNAVREPATVTLANDVHIEVEGAVVNGTLIATKIKLEGGDVKIHAAITNIGTDSFDVSPVAGQPAITIKVDSGTQLESDTSELEPFTFNDLMNADFVELRGYINSDGSITANEIDVKEPDTIFVQGIVQTGSSADSNIVKVLDVEFTILYPAETQFKDANGSSVSPTDFFNNSVILDTTLIKVKDDNADGIADSVELTTQDGETE